MCGRCRGKQEAEGERNWDSSPGIYTPLHVKQLTGRRLWTAQGTQLAALWRPGGVGWAGGWAVGRRLKRDGMYHYSCSVMTDSFETPVTVARQAPLSVGFSRQECWCGLPFPPPGDLPDQGVNPHLLHWRWLLYHLIGCGSQYVYTYSWFTLPYSRNCFRKHCKTIILQLKKKKD